MKLQELYAQTPIERHGEIVVSGDRVFFEGDEHVLLPDGELRLVRSQKLLEERLARIETALGI